MVVKMVAVKTALLLVVIAIVIIVVIKNVLIRTKLVLNHSKISFMIKQED
jgi:hypothetical protein